MYITNDAAKNLSGVRTLSAKEINHKEHKEHKETIDERLRRKPPKIKERGKPLRPSGSRASSPAVKTSRKVREVRKVMENNWDIFSFYLLFSLNRLKMLDNHKFLCYT